MNDPSTYEFGPFRVSVATRVLSRNDLPIALGARTLDLLLALVRRQGQVATKNELMDDVWPGTYVEENNLPAQIYALRKALDDQPEGWRYVQTIPGRGYRFVPPPKSDAVAAPDASLPLPNKTSIAVLPFANMSGDPEQQYFADGVAEDILTALARCGSLFVIARNSSFVYKDRPVDVRRVGGELGVRYVLEGSVRRSGQRLRVTGQLIDATSGAHVWANRFDGDLGDVFDLQDRITEGVVGAVEPALQLAEIERLKQKSNANFSSYDCLLRAQELEYEFTEESIDAALQELQRALQIDPTYAPAMALTALCYGVRRTQGWAMDSAEEQAEGLRFAMQALHLGTYDSNVLWRSAWATWQLGHDEERVLELAYRALEVNPNSAIAMAMAGRLEALAGNFAKGKDLLLRAQRLSPRDPRAWLAATGMSIVALGEDQYEDGAEWARRAHAQNPRFTGALRLLTTHLAYLGQVEEAQETLAKLLSIDPDLTISKFRSRRRFIAEGLFQKLSEGWRRAGLPL